MSRAEKRRREKLARKTGQAPPLHSVDADDQAAGGAPEGYLMELTHKGIALHQAGRIEDAENIYRQILEISPDHADANHLLGGLAFLAGRHDQAMESIAKAIAKAPDLALYHANLGTVYHSRERLDEAVDCYQKALAIQPVYIEAQLGLGNSLRSLGRLREAEAIYREALVEAPDNSLMHNNLGVTLQELGHKESAIACFHRAIAISPGYASAHGNLGKAYLEKGLPEEAIAWHKKALALDPNLAETHSNLGIAYRELTLYEDAVASFRRAIALNPDYSHAHSYLGNVLHSMGRSPEAVESCRKGVDLKPDQAEMHGNLGTALQGMGRVEEAIASYHRALALNPDFALAWFNLQSAIKASHYEDGLAVQSQDQHLAPFNDAARANNGYTSLKYYLASFKPHQADDSYHEAMASLPSRDEEEIIVDGVDEPQLEKAGAVELPAKPIAMLHFGRSGTGLLHSLIDGHPEISTFPSVYFRGYFNPGIWKLLSAGGWRELPDRFADMFEVLFDAKSPQLTPGIPGEQSAYLGVKEGMTTLGENRDQSLSLDRDAFCAEALGLLAGLDTVDPMTFLQIAHAAYESVLGTATRKHTMFFHIHNPMPYAKFNFLRYAPDARLLMMVREPLQCCESWLNMNREANDYSQASSRIIKMLYAIDEIPLRKQDSVGVRLEDLKNRPEATMGALCAWMGVEETPSLYEMTAQGKKWWGDPTSPDYEKNKGQSAFGKSSLNRAVGSIFGETDRLVLGTLYCPFSVRFGYREPDRAGFERDLKTIRPLLDEMLDFEKVMAERANQDHDAFVASGAYRMLHAGLLDRWSVLDELGDYPHMLTPLSLPQA